MGRVASKQHQLSRERPSLGHWVWSSGCTRRGAATRSGAPRAFGEAQRCRWRNTAAGLLPLTVEPRDRVLRPQRAMGRVSGDDGLTSQKVVGRPRIQLPVLSGPGGKRRGGQHPSQLRSQPDTSPSGDEERPWACSWAHAAASGASAAFPHGDGCVHLMKGASRGLGREHQGTCTQDMMVGTQGSTHAALCGGMKCEQEAT